MLIKRVLVGGWKNFARGGAVSAATVLIMTVTLSIIGSLIFLSALLSYTLNTIKDKVDVSVYFVTTGGTGALLAKTVKQVEVVAYEDLGAEAILRLDVEDFPAIVANDVYGEDLFEQGKAKYQRRK